MELIHKLYSEAQAFKDDLRPKYIMNTLLKNKTITEIERIEIMAKVKPSDQVEVLFSKLCHKSPWKLKDFIKALEKDEDGCSPYPWLAKKLETACDINDKVYQILINGNVPFSISHLLPRDDKLIEIRDSLMLASHRRRHWVVLYGPIGSGKSVLAAEALRNNNLIEQCFPNGVYWLSIGSLKDDEAIKLKFKKLFKLMDMKYEIQQDDGAEDLKDLLKKEVGGRKILVILDDVFTAEVIKAFDIGCPILVTTKNLSALDKYSSFCSKIECKNNLKNEDILYILSKYVNCEINQLPEVVNDICVQCKGSPLVSSLIGSYMADIGNNRRKWEHLHDKLQERGTGTLRKRWKSGEKEDFGKIINLCLEPIQHLKDYYLDFLIFSKDVSVSNQIQNRHKKLIEKILNLCILSDGSYDWTKLPQSYIPFTIGYHLYHADVEYSSYLCYEQNTNVIVDINILRTLLNAISKWKHCNSSNCFDVLEEVNSRKGLVTSLLYICKSCGYSTSAMTSNISETGYDINTRLVYAFRCIGIGKTAAHTVCAVMNLPPPPAKFERFNNSLSTALEKVCSKSMMKAVEGDGDSKGYQKISDSKVYAKKIMVEKLEFIGHVQKRMGARLKTLKNKLKSTKLADGKKISGRGRLTDAEILQIQEYYGLAIRREASKSVTEMFKSIWAIYFHMLSTIAKPQHGLNPLGSDSWCGYNKSLITGQKNKSESNYRLFNCKAKLSFKGMKHATFNHDASLVASVGEIFVEVWKTSVVEVSKALYGHSDVINYCSFNSKGDYLATASSDKTVRIFHIGESLTSSGDYSKKRISIPNFQQNKNIQMYGSPKEDNSKVIFTEHGDEVMCCSYSPDDHFIISSDSGGKTYVREGLDGHLISKSKPEKENVTFCSLSSNCLEIVYGTKSGDVKVWDTSKKSSARHLSVMEGHGNQDITFCDVSPGDVYLASSSVDGSVKFCHLLGNQGLNVLANRHDSVVHRIMMEILREKEIIAHLPAVPLDECNLLEVRNVELDEWNKISASFLGDDLFVAVKHKTPGISSFHFPFRTPNIIEDFEFLHQIWSLRKLVLLRKLKPNRLLLSSGRQQIISSSTFR
ncbi:Apoptotic protease-activating factor 1 like protein [Argiope bruennichi]|uniref:Apoptotic protease-activating factor 1 like protein n=1 Tax=Argiope bruennichi TaxID=94029 RepID=A0A8T0EZI0_ARGBR|nr:Apoptotic protease-activating factor 1 like protein [Argiope bruennichi]